MQKRIRQTTGPGVDSRQPSTKYCAAHPFGLAQPDNSSSAGFGYSYNSR
ncbi:MAG: hypothetical protein AB8H12_08870 [Lewinella sp.]